MKVYYDGIGCNKTGVHTEKEFLNIMKNASTHYYEMTAFGINMEYKNYLLPDAFTEFTLEEWIDYSGAVYYDAEW